MSWFSGLAKDGKRWRKKRFAHRFVHRKMLNADSEMWNVMYRGAFREAMWKAKAEIDGHWVCWR